MVSCVDILGKGIVATETLGGSLWCSRVTDPDSSWCKQIKVLSKAALLAPCYPDAETILIIALH